MCRNAALKNIYHTQLPEFVGYVPSRNLASADASAFLTTMIFSAISSQNDHQHMEPYYNLLACRGLG